MATKRVSKYRAKEEGGGIHLLPRTDKQARYIDALKTSPQVIVTGSAGTGKTYIASCWAAKQFAEGRVQKIVLTRPNVPAGRSLGFFPGTLEEKIAPWVVPFTDVIKDCLGAGAFDSSMKKGSIEIVPFEVMRGRTFHDSFIILDEAQNTSPTEMKMFLTRIGDNSQVVINGDIKQSDLKEKSGLATILKIISQHRLPVPHIEFTVEDIVRSDACAMWVKAFDKAGI